MRLFLLPCAPLIIGSLSGLPLVVDGSIVSVTKDVLFQADGDWESGNISETASTKQHIRRNKRVGRIRYHYDDTRSEMNPVAFESNFSLTCSHVVMEGVGTSMTVDQYDKIAAQIVTGTSFVFITTNHNVNGIVKTSATQYATLINAIYKQLEELVPVCAGTKKFIVGGHSSSGQAAFEAVQNNLLQFEPFAFFALDPYQIIPSRDQAQLQLPALYWGLTSTTCFVNAKSAAMGAYQQSSPEHGRILYAIDNDPRDANNSQTTHCVFTDHGCGVASIIVCPTKATFDWVYESVATSLQIFLRALDTNKEFQNEMFKLPTTDSGAVLLHVNEEISTKGRTAPISEIDSAV
jgi:hypothetical protein